MDEHVRHGHLPYRKDCPVCVGAKARNAPHVRREHPEVLNGPPVVQIDYCFLGDDQEVLKPIWAGCVAHTGACFGHVCECKGAKEKVAVSAFLRWLLDNGLDGPLRLRTDPETSIMDVAREVSKRRTGTTILETTAVASWKSKGAVEGYTSKLGGNVRAI